MLAEDASLRMIELLDAFPAEGGRDAMRAWTEDWFATYESNGGVISVWQEMQTAEPTLAEFSLEVAVRRDRPARPHPRGRAGSAIRRSTRWRSSR